MTKRRAVFVTGAGRSGTKFLMNILNRHPDVYIAPELHLFSRILHTGFLTNLRRRVKKNNGELTLNIAVECILNDSHFGTYWHLNSITESEIRQHFEASAVTEKGLYEFLIEHDRNMYPSKKNVPLLGEKTPANVFHLDKLIQWFDDCIIFYIYRDPVRVLESEVNKGYKPGYPLKRTNPFYSYGLVFYVLLSWLWGARCALRKAQYPHMVFVSYQALSTQTDAEVTRLIDRAGFERMPAGISVKKVDSSFSDRQNPWAAPAWVKWLYGTLTQRFLSRLDTQRLN